MTPPDQLKKPAKSATDSPAIPRKRFLPRINSAPAGTFPRRLFGKKSESVSPASPASPASQPSPVVEDIPEFSVYLNRSIKIKDEKYLRGEEGDQIIVRSRIATNLFIGENGWQQGYIMSNSLDFDHHTENVYLRTMDVLVENPKLMVTLLTRQYNAFPDHALQLVHLLSARRLLLPALQKLCQLECQKMTDVGTGHVTFRDESPAVKMITSMLMTSSESLHQYYRDFTGFLVKSLGDREELDSEFLASLLKKSIEHLNKDAPPILIMILRAIKSGGEGCMTPEKCSLLMGGIFFLRCICPALSQKQPMQQDNLKLIANALLKISNHEDPSNEKLIPVLNEMRNLRPSVVELFERITRMVQLPICHPSSLILNAASFYGLVMREFEMNTDEDIRRSLATLKFHLGAIPTGVKSEEDLPMWNDIRRIRALRVGEETLQQGMSPK